MRELWLTKFVEFVSLIFNIYFLCFIISCTSVIQTQASEPNKEDAVSLSSAPGQYEVKVLMHIKGETVSVHHFKILAILLGFAKLYWSL